MGHAGNAVGGWISDSQWIAACLRPRDDKGGIFTMMGMKKIRYVSCHCEERLTLLYSQLLPLLKCPTCLTRRIQLARSLKQ